MNSLSLNLASDITKAVDFKPTERVIAQINEAQPDWLQTGAINLKLVDDKQIQALNKQYSGNDYATDVLSFSYIETPNAQETPGVKHLALSDQSELGDMVISFETAARQAKAAGTDLADELATLVLHGVLHIYGLDHAEPAERRIMDQLQSQLLAAANVTYRNFNWL